jgi:hydrogenase nickel incorporation protein HypB
MCDVCGCDGRATRTIEVHERLLQANEGDARHNREHFARARVLAVNLMGAPGAGKTALLEATIRAAPRGLAIAAIEGDQATARDSERIRAAGAAAVQIETGLGCHLDAAQVHEALDDPRLANARLLFIENVGNLVCPALFDLGEHLRAVVTSAAEGADKPLKYPPMFRAADIVVLNKSDLLPHLPFDLGEWRGHVEALNPRATVIVASAITGAGIDRWLHELTSRLDALARAAADSR